MEKWEVTWGEGTDLVMEGWENWLHEKVISSEDDQHIRTENRALLQHLVAEEQERDGTVILIMLEIGRGIVPIDKSERRVRDLSGWLLQDAVELSQDVHYVWHGLAKKIK